MSVTQPIWHNTERNILFYGCFKLFFSNISGSVVSFSTAFNFPKDSSSSWARKMNQVLRRIVESGLVQRFTERHVPLKYLIAQSNTRGKKAVPTVLKLEHVAGGMFVWIVGMVLSLIVSAIEMGWSRFVMDSRTVTDQIKKFEIN